MASIEYVVNATGNLSAFLEKAGLTADHLDSQLEDLSKRIATPEVDLKDTKFTLGMVNAAKRLDKLSAMVASPEVEVDTAKAQVEILRINTMLDRLDGKTAVAHVKVDVDRGRLGAAAAGVGGLLGAGAAGIGRAVPGLGGLLSTPQGAIATLVAGLASLPFAATAAAGGIVAALGGGMTAIGVIAAAKNKQVAKSFTDLKTSASKDLAQISVPFQAVLKSIAAQAQSVLPRVMGALGDAFKAAAGPLQTFSNTLIRSLASPSVLRAIRDLGGAFGAILKALAPSLPSIINQIADGIDGIAQAIQAHPKIFADMINFLGHLVGWSLQAIGALTRVAAWLVKFTVDVGHWLNIAWHAFTGFFTTVHNGAVAFQNAVVATFRALWHNIITALGNLRDAAVTVWNTIWRNTRNAVTTGISAVVGFFRGLPGRAIGALRGLGTSLYAFAHAALTDFLHGLWSVGGTVLGWLRGFVGKIVGLVGKLLRLGSPSGVFFDIGKNMMLGLANGIRAHAHTAANAARSAAQGAVGAAGGPATGGAYAAQQYAASRLGAYGWGRTQFGPLLALWNQESGWNRLARNPSSGAYGIPQALPPGKMGAAANPPTSSMAAQINWGLSYIRGRYGSPAGAWAHEQAYNWYDRGGWLPAGVSLAVNRTGRPERVLGPGEGLGTSITYNVTINVPPGASAAQIGRSYVHAIKEYERSSGAGWRR